MTQDKKCAVIVVTYNEKKWYDKCFQSILSSSVPLKIYVVDNNSTDASVFYIANKFTEIEIIQNEENFGFAEANNIALKVAYDNGYDYFFLLNQDAWVEYNTIETLIEVAQKNPNFGILSPVHLTADKTAFDYRFKHCSLDQVNMVDVYENLYCNNQEATVYETHNVNAAAWLLTKECVETVGGFDTILFNHYGEDNNYCQRVLFHKLKIGIVPSVTICHDRAGRADINKPLSAYIGYSLFWGNIKFGGRKKLLKHFAQMFIKEGLSKKQIKNARELFWLLTNLKKLSKSWKINKIPGKGLYHMQHSGFRKIDTPPIDVCLSAA